MAQIVRPISDVAANGWTTQAGATTGLFGMVDETVADDADFLRVDQPDGDTLKLALGVAGDPQSSSGHVLRYRIGKSGNDVINQTVALMEGLTEIASWDHEDVALGFTDYAQTLTAPQADAITDYGALEVWVTASVGGDLVTHSPLWWLNNYA